MYIDLNYICFPDVFRTPSPRSLWTSSPALKTNSPSAVQTEWAWRTVDRVSTAQPRACSRTRVGHQQVSLFNYGPEVCLGFEGNICMMHFSMSPPQRSWSSVYSQLCWSSVWFSWSSSRPSTTLCFFLPPVRRRTLRTLQPLRYRHLTVRSHTVVLCHCDSASFTVHTLYVVVPVERCTHSSGPGGDPGPGHVSVLDVWAASEDAGLPAGVSPLRQSL